MPYASEIGWRTFSLSVLEEMTDFDSIFEAGPACTPLFKADSAFRRQDGLYAASADTARPASINGVPLPRHAAAAASSKPGKKRKTLSDTVLSSTKPPQEKNKRVKRESQSQSATRLKGSKAKAAQRQVHQAPTSHTQATAGAGKQHASPAHLARQSKLQPAAASHEAARDPPAAEDDGDAPPPADDGNQAASPPGPTARQVSIIRCPSKTISV